MLSLTTLHYAHRHGDDTSVHLSDDAALDAVYDLVLANWAEVDCDRDTCGVPGCAGIPETPSTLDRDSAIGVYFAHSRDEYWHIENHQVPLTILITPEQACAWADDRELTAGDLARLAERIPTSTIPDVIGDLAFALLGPQDDTAKTDPCDECGATIPDTEGGDLFNDHHSTACSLHPTNLSDNEQR